MGGACLAATARTRAKIAVPPEDMTTRRCNQFACIAGLNCLRPPLACVRSSHFRNIETASGRSSGPSTFEYVDTLRIVPERLSRHCSVLSCLQDPRLESISIESSLFKKKKAPKSKYCRYHLFIYIRHRMAHSNNTAPCFPWKGGREAAPSRNRRCRVVFCNSCHPRVETVQLPAGSFGERPALPVLVLPRSAGPPCCSGSVCSRGSLIWQRRPMHAPAPSVGAKRIYLKCSACI